MKLLFKLLFCLSVLFVYSSSAAGACSDSDHGRLLTRAFADVPKFNTSWVFNSTYGNCFHHDITEIRVPGRNLNGTVDWKSLARIKTLRVLDLSGNSLNGTLPSNVWNLLSLVELNVANNLLHGTVSSQSNLELSHIEKVDLSFNRFNRLGDLSNLATNLTSLDISGNNFNSTLPLWLSNLTKLQFLDVSGCNLSGNVSSISGLKSLTYLDVSRNDLTGNFSGDFPLLEQLQVLNVSFNNFSGVVESAQINKFGASAFINGGNNLLIEKQNRTPTITTTSPDLHQNPSNPIDTVPVPYTGKGTRGAGVHRRKLITIASVASSLVFVIGVLCFMAIFVQKRRRKAEKWSISMPIQIPPFRIENEKSGPFSFETESGSSWIADIREPTSAPVILFEKPLMNHLTFKDLMFATSHFGKESLMAEGRSGPVYRAVLPGELHVAIKVLENVRHVSDAAEMLQQLSKLKHPNLLPICGYCIAGKGKLVLSPFMGHGDLRRWLRELPTGAANVEDFSGDAWEEIHTPDDISPEKLEWRTRYRIAVGVARGVAYLHHAGSKPVVHGHLVPSNVLLDEDLEPRITDFGFNQGGSTAEDVYHFGVILMELLTYDFKLGSIDKIRRLVKDRRSVEAIDRRLRNGEESVSSEMVKCLEVAYLCTADALEKRPSMQQVLGLLKDIYPSSS